jgi:hypothetical protein
VHLTIFDAQHRFDGETLGEVMFRGNVVMKGYLKEQGFDGGGVRRRRGSRESDQRRGRDFAAPTSQPAANADFRSG